MLRSVRLLRDKVAADVRSAMNTLPQKDRVGLAVRLEGDLVLLAGIDKADVETVVAKPSLFRPSDQLVRLGHDLVAVQAGASTSSSERSLVTQVRAAWRRRADVR